MANPELIKISVDQIDFNDPAYIFTFESPSSRLFHSIKKIGVINPPIIEKRVDHNYRIVSGLKRIVALKNLKITQFLARVYYSDRLEPNIELFRLNLYENIGTRHLNQIEKSSVIHKLINLFHVSPEQVIHEFLPLLELTSNNLVLARYLKLAELEDDIKKAVAEDFLSMDIALNLQERSTFERMTILNLFQALRLGKNQQKEVFNLLRDLTTTMSQTIDQIIMRDEIQNILMSDRVNLSRKIEYLKEILRKLRYPVFSRMEKSFQNLKQDLKLPPNIILKPPPFFEGEKYTIEMRFKNQLEFKKLTGILSSIADHNKLTMLESF